MQDTEEPPRFRPSIGPSTPPYEYKEGFRRWAEGIAEETGLPVDDVITIAKNSDPEEDPDDGVIPITDEHRERLAEELQKMVPAGALRPKEILYPSSAERMNIEPPTVEIPLAELDGMIDRFLSTRGCTLWGEQWTITYPDTRAKAHAFIRKTMLQVLEHKQ